MADSPPLSARLAMGVPGLDELFGGGLLAGRSLLIKGPPGSGKTTLGLQCLVAAAERSGEPGLYLTFEQHPVQLIADAASFGWNLDALAERNLLKVLFVEPEEVLSEPGRHENRLLSRIEDWAEQTGAIRVLIDSISHMRRLSSGDEARSVFLSFIIRLKSMGLTPILTAELGEGTGVTEVDAYLADSVLLLRCERGGLGQPDRRELEIVKSRGQSHVPGAHPYEIGGSGITVFPHRYPEPADSGGEPPSAPATLSIGVAGLDSLLGGGPVAGSSILVAGLPGTFKTTLAAHFALANATPERPALWVALNESAAELQRGLGPVGLDLGAARTEGRLLFLELTPGREPIEKTLSRAEKLIAERSVAFVVIDGMSELTRHLTGVERREEAALWVLKRLGALGVATLFTERLARVTGRNPLSEIASANLADTVIFLGMVEIESRLEKVVSVLKHRGAPAAGDLCSIVCSGAGLSVSPRLIGLSGLMGGSVQGRRKAQIENVFQPLYFIRDFLKMAKDPDLPPADRERILDNLVAQSDKLIGLLGDYFEEPKAAREGRPPGPGEG